jgi:hypothetical protein
MKAVQIVHPLHWLQQQSADKQQHCSIPLSQTRTTSYKVNFWMKPCMLKMCPALQKFCPEIISALAFHTYDPMFPITGEHNGPWPFHILLVGTFPYCSTLV